MRLETPIMRTLGLRYPIALAAMDLVADARLSLAVLDAGGFAFLGAGYGEEQWLRRELAAIAPAARERGRKFGVGFITWSVARQPRLVDLSLEAGAQAIWFSFGDPAPLIGRVHAAGALAVCQVQTEDMAKAALDAGADMLVAQGTEAGGHGVSRGTMSLVPAVVDLAGKNVPVFAAGGIADGRGVAAALMLGAGGVVVGTRFYATIESAGKEAAKQRILEASGDDAVRSIVFDISRRHVWPAPYTGRCLSNGHLRKWLGREVELLRSLETGEHDRYMAARSKGEFDVAAVIAGESCGLVHDIPSAGDLVHRMAGEAASLLRVEWPESK